MKHGRNPTRLTTIAMMRLTLQILVSFSPVIARMPGNADGAAMALHVTELSAPLSEAHQVEGAKSVILYKQGSRGQSHSLHQMGEALDQENRPFIPKHDSVTKPKKFSAYMQKLFGGVFKFVRKFFKFLTSQPTPVHRTGKGAYQVPRLAAFFHIEKPWPVMDESPEVMKKELAKFTQNDLMSQVGNHQSLRDPLYKIYGEPLASGNIAEIQRQELEISREAERFIMELRTNLENLPEPNVSLEIHEKEKQILTVKALYILSQDPKYSSQAEQAVTTAILTWSQRPNPKPKLHRYMMAAHDLMTERKLEGSPMPKDEMPLGYPAHSAPPQIDEIE